jgi:hypothetical protein
MIAKFFGKTKIIGKTLIGTSGTPAPAILPYNLWDFPNSSGTSLNNVNLSFSPSTTVQINWGDGSIETISSDTNYNHTLT